MDIGIFRDTEDEYRRKVTICEQHTKIAYVPTKLSNGTWAWFKKYIRMLLMNLLGEYLYVNVTPEEALTIAITKEYTK